MRKAGELTYYFIVTAILWAGNLFSQQNAIAIDSKVDKSTITIGDLIKYTVEVTRSPEIVIEMPELASNLGAFEIRDYSIHEPKSKNGSVIERIDYTISTFDVGEFEIPPLVFHYMLPGDSTKNELRTQKINILVESLKPSEAGDIRDIKAPLALPRNFRRIIIWSSVGLAFLVLLLTSIYIWRRKRAGKGLLPQKVEPPRPAHEIALDQLKALKASTLLAEGNVKEYYIQMSEIIRRYIEGRYFIVALEMTTCELIQNLRNSEVEPENIQLIQEFLEFCDLIKFAKYSPSDVENDASISKAFELVDRTKLVYDVSLDEKREEKVEERTATIAEIDDSLVEKIGESK